MKQIKVVGFIIVLLLVAGNVLFLTLKLSDEYLGKSRPTGEAICKTKKQNHVVKIQNDVMNPHITNAQLCDTLTIINEQNKLRLVSFGVHEKHVPYDGITQRALKKDESFTITLNKLGIYVFHDHIQEETGGEFIVSE